MRSLFLVSVLLVSLGLVACSGDTTAPPFSSPSPAVDPGADLTDAVRAFSDACLAGDGEASWRLLSERGRDATSKDSWRAIVAEISRRWGKAKLKEIKVVAIGEDAALVSYRYTDPAIDQLREPWVREAGAWRCDQ